MAINNKNVTIIQNSRLSLYGFEYIDNSILEILKNTNHSKNSSKHSIVIYRLNCFLGLQNKKLNSINFYNDQKMTFLFADFYMFIKNGGFKGTYNSNKTIASTFLKIYYFNGWEMSGKKDVFCNLIEYYKKFGKNKTETFYKRIELYSKNSDNIGNSTASRVGVLNKLLKFYFDKNYSEIDEKMIFDFLKHFFIEADKKGLSLLAQKKTWNSSVDLWNIFLKCPKIRY